MDFEIIGRIRDVETIAAGRTIRQLGRLRRRHGKGEWRKRKGIATVRLQMAWSTRQRFIGMKLTASAGESSSSSSLSWTEE
jgi:hypothetical protein